ncbi:MAG TPA: CoA ester lyase [Candidatus Dormibacteraeota bacterium]|nr:CoA ester lyase [Candidatus Dormibacteraeota bacterium]
MAERDFRIRSALFTPGTEAARLRKAVTLGSDVCIFDLEDSVPAGREADARQTTREALEELGGRGRIWVRVHSAASPEMVADLAAIPLQKADAVVLPKVRGRQDLVSCRSAILAAKGPSDIPLVAMVETAVGVLNAVEIARAPDVLCLAFGRFDLSADLGIDPDGGSPALAAARAAVVLASTAAGLHRPIDSPWIKIHDFEGLRAAAQRARADGFGGMQLIHPSHVDTANEVFSPTAEELAWAHGILASAGQAASTGHGAYTHDGQMVDEAIVKRARAIVRNAAS